MEVEVEEHSELKELIEKSKELIKKSTSVSIPEEYKNYELKDKNDPSFEKGDLVKYNERSGYDNNPNTVFKIIETHRQESKASYVNAFESQTELIIDNADAFMNRDFQHITDKKSIEEYFKQNAIFSYLREGGIVTTSSRNFLKLNLEESLNSHVINFKSVVGGRNLRYSQKDILRVESVVKMPTEKELEGCLEKLIKEKEIKEKLKGILQAMLTRVYPDSSQLYTASEFGSTEVNKGTVRGSIAYVMIIHFKEFVISNGTLEHTIKDLYIRIDLDIKGNVVGRLQGLRATQTYSEFKSKYTHSHLNQGSLMTWGSFCLGNTDMSFNLAQLHNRFAEIELEAFLHRLKSYVVWESIDGGPHRLIEDIRISSNHSTYTFQPEDIISKLKQVPIKVTKKRFYDTLSIKKYDPSFLKHLGEIMEDFIAPEDYGDSESACFTYFNPIESTFENIGTAPNKKRIDRDILVIRKTVEESYYRFKFKDEEVKGTILDYTQHTTVIPEHCIKTINENSIQVLMKQLNKKITQHTNYITKIKYYNDKESKQGDENKVSTVSAVTVD